MTRIKICGLRDAAMAVEVAKAGADFIGMVFAESKRRVTPQQCHDICEALREARRTPEAAQFDGPRRGEVSDRTWFGAWNEAIDDAVARWRPLIVGVFADQPVDDVNNIADAAGLDIVQLGGGEDDVFAAKIHLPVFRTVHIEPGMSADDVFELAPPGVSASIFLDTAVKGARGGTGVSFDWAVAAEAAQRLPLMMAGGLTPENVAAAVEQVRPWAVDVSSGVETNGSKDIEKVRAFIRAVKGVR